MFRFHTPDTFDLLEELRTGHRTPNPPRNPMKITSTILLALVLLAFVLAFTGCATETTRTITTDKNGTVTDTTVVKKGTDPTAMKLVEVAAAVYLPKPAVIVREEKCDHDMRRLLQGRPITHQEIAMRWKPSPP